MSKTHYLYAKFFLLESCDVLKLQIAFEEKSFGATIKETVVHSRKMAQHLQDHIMSQ